MDQVLTSKCDLMTYYWEHLVECYWHSGSSVSVSRFGLKWMSGKSRGGSKNNPRLWPRKYFNSKFSGDVRKFKLLESQILVVDCSSFFLSLQTVKQMRRQNSWWTLQDTVKCTWTLCQWLLAPARRRWRPRRTRTLVSRMKNICWHTKKLTNHTSVRSATRDLQPRQHWKCISRDFTHRKSFSAQHATAHFHANLNWDITRGFIQRWGLSNAKSALKHSNTNITSMCTWRLFTLEKGDGSVPHVAVHLDGKLIYEDTRKFILVIGPMNVPFAGKHSRDWTTYPNTAWMCMQASSKQRLHMCDRIFSYS